ncbi:MAG: M81 family metallopeptidase [Alphaproteobacteria bacterium]|nr:M81 family metallopeptidase [Alphaproteobacteria bacterium]
MPRLAILRFSHEGNSFNPVVTGREAFEQFEWLKGEVARVAYRGTRTEMGAAVDFLDARHGWEGEFLRCAAAPPGGPVPDLFISEVIGEAVADLSGGGWDGVYVSLHGAMLGVMRNIPDLDMLRAIRSAVGPNCPIAVSFDLHANMAWEIGSLIEIAAGFKTYPHVDTYETAEKALDLLARTVAGEIKPYVAIERGGLVLPSHNMRTDSGPMAEIEALAREMETRHGLFDVSPFGGFAYGDTSNAGISVTVTAERLNPAAQSVPRTMCMEMIRRRKGFIPAMPSAEATVRNLAQNPPAGLTAIVEPADNPMSGGIGDTPALFRALVDARPEVPSLFAFFRDPPLVDLARVAGEGAELDASLGGRMTGIYGPPVETRLRVLRLTDGKFVNSGPMWRGAAVDLGGSVLFELVANPMIKVIVTRACISPNDHGYFQLHGVNLSDVRLLAAKAKNHFRAAFGPVCARIVDVDTPGPATANMTSLPFKHVTRDMLPPWPGMDGRDRGG